MTGRQVISIEGVSKHYRLGEIGSRTLVEDVGRLVAKLRGRPDPLLRIGQENTREEAGGSVVWALRDIDLAIEEGEVVGIVGRNGAGKSTLLKLLSRITLPSTGRIRARGRIASLLEVGTGFHPELSGRDNIYLNGAILGMRREEVTRRLDEIVDFSGCAKYVDTPVKRYSTGMIVRLAFAVAAHLDCEILIVDEVLAVGDAEFQKKCIGKMRGVASENGRTVIFVSHNMASVAALCSRAVLLERGRLEFDGSPGETIAEYDRESQTLATTALTDRIDRLGDGAIRFNKMEISGDGADVGSFSIRSGSPAIFRAFYSIRDKSVPLESRFNIAIRSETHPLVFLSTEFQAREWPRINDDGFVEFRIERLPLTPGRYSASIYAHTAPKRLQDLIEAAAYFDVLEGDFYGGGKDYLPTWRGKTVLVDHQWRLGHDRP